MSNKLKQTFTYLDILITLGKMGATRRLVSCTTTELGNSVGMSQQTTSRKLVEMENQNLIVRQYSQRGNQIKITPEGISTLEQVFTDLWMVLSTSGRETKEQITLKGKIITGMNEGAYYLQKGSYLSQLTMILGFSPFPGTLNIQILDDVTLQNFERLLRLPARFIPGFKEQGRVFGKVFVWPSFLLIKSHRIPSAIIRPDRTHHTSQIEIVAHENIRETYNVTDGDEIEITLR